MAKKTAPKKKTATAKPAKAAAKPSKKPAAKPVAKKPMVSAAKAAPKAAVKPATKLKTTSVKKQSEDVEEKVVAKTQTVVSMIEDSPETEESAKAEKVSKVKPVKIERGNLADEKAKWAELNKKYGKEKAITYKMSEKFPTMIPLQHKVLGWGFVLTNENDRLEVLFETGIRMLISNYKG